MRAPIPITIALVTAREALRAIAFPLHGLAFFLRRRHWANLCRGVVTEQAESSGADPLARFVAQHKPAASSRHVFISAGEVSGETHGVNLMRAAQRGNPDLRWSCFGGSAMERAGGTLLYPLSSHAIMGVAGVLKSLPFIVRGLACYLRMLRTDPPALVVLVDYPGLHLVMGRLARKHGVPVLHYIAPQYWAWAPWRLQRYRGCMDATLTILPFETGFFERFGLPAEYVGHPLLDHLEASPAEPHALELVRATPTLCMLPGSRRAEIQKHLPAFVSLAQQLRTKHPELRFAVTHVDPRRTELIQSILRAEDPEQILEFHHGPLAPWLQGSRAVVAKSGTGSLESCLHGNPTVVVYKLPNALWTWMYRNLISIPWISLPNLVIGREIVPEHVFDGDDGWAGVETSLHAALTEGPQRDRTLVDLEAMRQRLGSSGASERAARWITTFFA